MATDLLHWLVEATLATSAALIVVLLLRQPLRRLCGVAGAYLLWLAVPASLLAVSLPAGEFAAAALVPGQVAASSLAPMAATVEANVPVPWIVAAWAAGALLSLAWLQFRQRRFMRALGPLQQRADGFLQSATSAGLPAVVGWDSRIVLPGDFEQRFDAQEQQLVLCHERMHRRRGDVPASLFAALLRCVFWFNPLLHVAAEIFAVDQELACDAAVLRRHPDRRRYGNALLKFHVADMALPPVAAGFGAHPLKERIHMLTRPLPTPLRWSAGVVTSLLVAGGIATAAWAAQPGAVAESPTPAASDRAEPLPAEAAAPVATAPGEPVVQPYSQLKPTPYVTRPLLPWLFPAADAAPGC